MQILNRSEGPKPGYCAACQKLWPWTYEVESGKFRLCLPHIAYAYRLATNKK